MRWSTGASVIVRSRKSSCEYRLHVGRFTLTDPKLMNRARALLNPA